MTLQNAVEHSRAARLGTAIANEEVRLFRQWVDTVIIGQPRGKDAVATACQRTMSRIRVGRKPRAVFIFLGPTSCGKSGIVYRFVEWLHGDRRCLLKLDGSEYQHEGELTKLKGATNMWAGRVNKYASDYRPPAPTEKDTTCEFNHHNVNVYPRAHSKTGRKSSVILVDEWDKACREFNDIFLSIMRDGFYTNGGSEEVDFSETIIFFTGNNGASAVEEARDNRRKKRDLGFSAEERPRTLGREEEEKLITAHLKKHAAPEFRSRVNELGGVVFFDSLTTEQVFEVCGVQAREAAEEAQRIAGVDVELGDDVKHWLLDRYDGDLAKVSGGLTTHVLDVLDNELIKGSVNAGDSVKFVAEGKQLGAFLQERPLRIFTPAAVDLEAELSKASQRFKCGITLPISAAAVPPDIDERMQNRRRARHTRVHNSTMVKTVLESKSEIAPVQSPAAAVLQRFLLTLFLADEQAVNEARTKLMQMAAKYGMNKLHEEIDPVSVQSPQGDLKALRLRVKVLAEIGRMCELKSVWSEAAIKTEETEI
ncbi:MAG TPA: AAA family ATPase [Planktothrix sp.]|jgi:hypothetical protein